MAAPKMSTCGDYMAIGDVGANSVYIFNGAGNQGEITLEKPLQDLRVSRQGSCCRDFVRRCGKSDQSL